MKSLKTNVIIFLFTLNCLTLIGQNATVTNIEESRTLEGSWDYCRIDIKPIGDETRNYTFYRVHEIKNAFDNKGVDLIGDINLEKEYKPMSEPFNIVLQKASRSATNINVDGVLYLYKPTEANGGIVKLSGFTKKPDFNLAPKDAKYKIFFYDKQTMLKKNAVDMNDRFAIIDKLPESERDFANDVNSLVSSVTYYGEDDLERAIFLIVGGDRSTVLGFTFEDSKGKGISPSTSSISNSAHTYFFDHKIDPNMKILVNVENPKSIKTIPFYIKNIILP